jgi:hypothetical protein
MSVPCADRAHMVRLQSPSANNCAHPFGAGGSDACAVHNDGPEREGAFVDKETVAVKQF